MTAGLEANTQRRMDSDTLIGGKGLVTAGGQG